jgi:hypothetical protein
MPIVLLVIVNDKAIGFISVEKVAAVGWTRVSARVLSAEMKLLAEARWRRNICRLHMKRNARRE